ncbi:hypothetical protein CEXT_371361 [Caerostris extrusa]|uniref:Secreted protein n=1 Tax=Caerostris extrusa TaxID=172846 RepID=A0AAV4URG9_CAEEX|nr:hypothetical protein CEXT_371361 [Caerostris extrusa]
MHEMAIWTFLLKVQEFHKVFLLIIIDLAACKSCISAEPPICIIVSSTSYEKVISCRKKCNDHLNKVQNSDYIMKQ